MLRLAVGPWGKLEPHTGSAHPDASASAGQVFGDRGTVVDASGQLVRQFESARWVYGPSPGAGTALLVLDEVTALAAGHRPCEVSDPARFAAFASALMAAQGFTSPPAPEWIDSQLHAERLDASAAKPLHMSSWRDVTDGAVVEHDWGAWLVLGDSLHRWSPTGYVKRALRPRHGTARILTPPLTLTALAAGYRPAVHSTASRSASTFSLVANETGPAAAKRTPIPPELAASRDAGEIRVRFHTTGTPWWRDEDHSMLGISYETIGDALFGELGAQRFFRWGGSFARMTSLMPRPVHAVVWQEGSLADVVIAGLVDTRAVVALVPGDVVVPVLRTLDMAPRRARDMIPELFRSCPKLDLLPEAFEPGSASRLFEVPASSGPQPGWYPDPVAEADLRWWDGTTWSAHVREHPSRMSPGQNARAVTGGART